MAKTRSIIKHSGTIGEITYVDSVAYGSHSRAKRGTYTPISLADGMKESSVHQREANMMAKLIFDSANEFAPGFKNGKFWSRLVSIFRRQKKAGVPYQYADFRGLEMRQDYPSSMQGRFQFEMEGNIIKLNYKLHATAAYRLSMMRLASAHSLLALHSNEIQEVWTQQGENKGVVEFNFTPLPSGLSVIYFLQCEQLENGEPNRLLKGRSVVLMC
jgi:hypothetical protein